MIFEGQGLYMIEEKVSISNFKATCLNLLKKVKQTGRPVLATRRSEPVALIPPLPPEPEKPKTWLGIYEDRGRIIGDIISPAGALEDWEVLNNVQFQFGKNKLLS
jgi:antitoxin (DNA-binding transcriptional repressor) of toxin-antitoxin stability system